MTDDLDHVPFGAIVPDLPAPITGYRSWSWSPMDGRLVSLGGLHWPPGEVVVAECQKAQWAWASSFEAAWFEPCAEPPSSDSMNHAGRGCGFYAYATEAAMWRPVPLGTVRSVWVAKTLGAVFGTVELGGRVFEHHCGYRASHACVSGLFRTPDEFRTPGESDVGMMALAESYGVPLLDPKGRPS